MSICVSAQDRQLYVADLTCIQSCFVGFVIFTGDPAEPGGKLAMEVGDPGVPVAPPTTSV